MGECSTSQFVQLSKMIFVPQEWPIKGVETFLLKLAKTIIDDISPDNFIVLQVHNIPTILVRDEGKYETRYFFKTISRPFEIDAYVIDVVFGKNEMSSNSKISNDLTTDEISLDDYVIITRQSENRTAYYLIAKEERATDRDNLIFLVALAIAGLVYIMVMNKISG